MSKEVKKIQLEQHPLSFSRESIVLLRAASIQTVQELLTYGEERLTQDLEAIFARNRNKLEKKVDVLPVHVGLFAKEMLEAAQKVMSKY